MYMLPDGTNTLCRTCRKGLMCGKHPLTKTKEFKSIGKGEFIERDMENDEKPASSRNLSPATKVSPIKLNGGKLHF
jgi:hypothetical protein